MSFFNEIADMLGYSEARIALGYNYVNYNGEAVYVEGALGIIKITDCEIVLRIKRGVLYVYGEGLKISDLCGKSVLIRGNIDSVQTSAKTGGEQ